MIAKTRGTSAAHRMSFLQWGCSTTGKQGEAALSFGLIFIDETPDESSGEWVGCCLRHLRSVKCLPLRRRPAGGGNGSDRYGPVAGSPV
jgi:hypothetical protein